MNPVSDHSTPAATARQRWYQRLEGGTERPGLHLTDTALVTLIVLNVAAVMLETEATIAARHADAFRLFELLSVALFTVDYAARLWVTVERGGRYADPILGRLRYALTPLAIVDLAAIAPFYLGLLFAVDLRLLRVLRLLRIFKLTRYSQSLSAIAAVMREELALILGLLVIMLVLLVLAAGGIYLFEHDVQPEDFRSIPAAMWWAMATLTTVGYGDVTPMTPVGKLFGGLVMMAGIGMVALPAGVLASALSEHLRTKRESFEDLVERALADGRITADDRHTLEAMREELGLSQEDARRILSRMARDPSFRLTLHCPHCGKPVGAGDHVTH